MCDSPHLRAGRTLKHGSGNLTKPMSTTAVVVLNLVHVAYHGLRVVRDVTRCTVSLLMIIFCITYRYIDVRVLQSIVDTSEEIWYQFILEACARKYQPNKELREKHGVLEISLLAEKVCTI